MSNPTQPSSWRFLFPVAAIFCLPAWVQSDYITVAKQKLKQSGTPETLEKMTSFVKAEVDLKDFPKKLKVSEALGLMYEQFYNQGMAYPIALDSEAFKEDGKPPVYDMPVKLPQGKDKMSVESFLHEIVKAMQHKKATFVIWPNVIMITTTDRAMISPPNLWPIPS